MRKKWYKSKTLWFNVIVAIGAAAEASLNVIEPYFDPRFFYGLLVLVPAINVVLRFATNQEIGR